MNVIVLNCNMNNLQKIFVMVAVGSIVVLMITIFATEVFNLKSPFISYTNLGYDAITKYGHKNTNWFGMIAVFNIVVSSIGFFLFKDK